MQVLCVPFMNLIPNKTFKEQIDKYLSQQFDVKTSQNMSKTLKQESTFVVALIIFYKNGKSVIFKGLGVVVCFYIERYMCVDYFSLQR